ncbi:MAG: SDR family oxidoreductase [Hyphomicrobiaceae bacterium]|nr:SDR family oxidoreductase [Hyphomicrobiaceae bacterium]
MGWKSGQEIKFENLLERKGLTVYAVTKAGLIGITQSCALEFASHGINVNYVGRGTIATEMFTQMYPAGAGATIRLINRIPLGRMGLREGVANRISFLASDESSFITGQTIFVCGGPTVGAVHV